jgi:hypothetical protein
MAVMGRLIILVFLVLITSGIYISETLLLMILVSAPSIPHIVVGTMSKLKIYDINITRKNCFINSDSGFTLR